MTECSLNRATMVREKPHLSLSGEPFINSMHLLCDVRAFSLSFNAASSSWPSMMLSSMALRSSWPFRSPSAAISLRMSKPPTNSPFA